jgi:hypothetical protein
VRSWRVPAWVGLGAALVAASLLGFALGSAWTPNGSDLGGWHTGRGRVGIRKVTIEYDGWFYGATDSMGQWIDRQGTWHESGWPDCLAGRVGRTTQVRFQARQVTVDGQTWRPIVAIDCSRSG